MKPALMESLQNGLSTCVIMISQSVVNAESGPGSSAVMEQMMTLAIVAIGSFTRRDGMFEKSVFGLLLATEMVLA